MDRRQFIAALGASGLAAAVQKPAAAQGPSTARNVVLVRGLFADGSCWSELIARLQPSGLKLTSVQNPLTTLEESVAAAQRALKLHGAQSPVSTRSRLTIAQSIQTLSGSWRSAWAPRTSSSRRATYPSSRSQMRSPV